MEVRRFWNLFLLLGHRGYCFVQSFRGSLDEPSVPIKPSIVVLNALAHVADQIGNDAGVGGHSRLQFLRIQAESAIGADRNTNV